MKRLNKLCGIVILVAILSLIFLCGCSNALTGWKLEWLDNFYISYNVFTKEAFVGPYEWNGEESNMTITVPDDYRGYNITALGGTSNKPYAFEVCLPQELNGKNRLPYETQVPCEPNDENTVELIFTVRLGLNINELKNGVRGYIYKYATDDNLIDCTFYTVSYYYVCDEENETFYSQDGVLYLKSDGSKAEFERGTEQ